jgi:hypothetical protein
MNATGRSRGLEVTGGGSGVASHAGLALLRHLSDKRGLTSGLSQALPSPLWGHDRGRVVSDLACAIADGARVISDFRVMGDQRELFGQVASVPTAWRSLKEIPGAGDRAAEGRRRGEQGAPARVGTGRRAAAGPSAGNWASGLGTGQAGEDSAADGPGAGMGSRHRRARESPRAPRGRCLRRSPVRAPGLLGSRKRMSPS